VARKAYKFLRLLTLTRETLQGLERQDVVALRSVDQAGAPR